MSSPDVTIKASQRILARPYEGVDDLSSALELTELVIDGTPYSPGNVNLPRESLPIKSGKIRLFLDVDGVAHVLDEAGIAPKDVSVACIAFGSVVAESCTIFDQSLADFQSPKTVEIQGDPLIFDSPNGFDLRIALFLRSNLRRRAFRPRKAGIWLALAGFSVSPYTSQSRFCPVPMDDTIRARYGLPASCMSYVQVGEVVLLTDALEDEVEVFVDLAILRLIQENPQEPLATFVQLDLVSETLSAMIHRAAEQLSENSGFSSVEDMQAARRPIARVLAQVAKSGGLKPDELLLAATTNPGLVRSCVEAHIGLLKATSRALRGVS
jgi:hypothetical protein